MTRAERVRFWRTQVREMARYERLMQSAVAAELDRVAKEAAKTPGIGLESILFSHKQNMAAIYRSAYLRVMDAANKRHMRAVDKQTRDAAGVFALMRERWIKRNTATKVALVTQTTIANIRRAIQSANGEGQEAVGKRIVESTGGAVARQRALVIARTETHTANSAASSMTMDSMGLEYTKEWVAAADERTRPDHADADGQVVGKDEAFQVGGEALMFPGDPSASPMQSINCRCQVVFSVN